MRERAIMESVLVEDRRTVGKETIQTTPCGSCCVEANISPKTTSQTNKTTHSLCVPQKSAMMTMKRGCFKTDPAKTLQNLPSKETAPVRKQKPAPLMCDYNVVTENGVFSYIYFLSKNGRDFTLYRNQNSTASTIPERNDSCIGGVETGK